jgi:hypothetical protein
MSPEPDGNQAAPVATVVGIGSSANGFESLRTITAGRLTELSSASPLNRGRRSVVRRPCPAWGNENAPSRGLLRAKVRIAGLRPWQCHCTSGGAAHEARRKEELCVL